jgi:hypothetical protein
LSLAKKEIRAAFRNAVFGRDKNRCRVCGNLDPHHVTNRKEFPNGGYVEENGISLCPPCHEKAEVWHRNHHADFVPGYHPDELYELIGSNREKAMEADKLLANS